MKRQTERKKGRSVVLGLSCLPCPSHVFRAAVRVVGGKVRGLVLPPASHTPVHRGPMQSSQERQHCSNTSHILGSHFPIMNVTFSNFADIFKTASFHQSIITSKFLTASKQTSLKPPTAPGNGSSTFTGSYRILPDN